jgi:hypothetical protein
LTIKEAARKLTDIALEHLAQFSEEEQEARIEAFTRLNLNSHFSRILPLDRDDSSVR